MHFQKYAKLFMRSTCANVGAQLLARICQGANVKVQMPGAHMGGRKSLPPGALALGDFHTVFTFTSSSPLSALVLGLPVFQTN
jgi:hypothetical protein